MRCTQEPQPGNKSTLCTADYSVHYLTTILLGRILPPPSTASRFSSEGLSFPNPTSIATHVPASHTACAGVTRVQLPPFQAASSNPHWLIGIKTGSVNQWTHLNQLPGKSYPEPEGIAHGCTLSSLLGQQNLTPRAARKPWLLLHTQHLKLWVRAVTDYCLWPLPQPKTSQGHTKLPPFRFKSPQEGFDFKF